MPNRAITNTQSHQVRYEACKRCHEAVSGFLNSTFEDVINNLETENRKNSGETPIPQYYTPVLHDETKAQVENTLRVYRDALDKYGLDKLSISYNGGKDCLVMMVIYLAAIYEYIGDRGELRSVINSVYINNEETFNEQDEFLKETTELFALDLFPIKSGMREGFEYYLKEKPQVEAIVVGVRRIDPYGAYLNEFQRTDHGWPDFVRVNSVLEWTTPEIWYFLKATGTKYCILYDQGYTSLGGVKDTLPNPLLKKQDGSYLPAYMLQDGNSERLGRVSDRKKPMGKL